MYFFIIIMKASFLEFHQFILAYILLKMREISNRLLNLYQFQMYQF